MTDCWILGAGGHAKIVIDALHSTGGNLQGVMDQDTRRVGQMLASKRIAAFEINALDGQNCHIAIGSANVRRAIASQLRCGFLSITHIRAWTSPSARIAAGTFLGANSVVQADAVVGEHVIVNTAAVVEHDCIVGDFTHLAPGAILGGGAQVGAGCLIGTGASVLPQVRIGQNCIVGAGAVVVRDVSDGATIMGVPGKVR